MTLVQSVIAAGVPVPDLGPRPELYSPTPAARILLVMGMIGVIVFTVQALGTNRRAARGAPVLLPFLITLALMVIPLGVAYIVMERGEDAALDRANAYTRAEWDARETVVPQLEAYYGIEFADPRIVPVQRDYHERLEVTLANGDRVDCYVMAEETYEVRCGGDTPEDSEPLEPVNP